MLVKSFFHYFSSTECHTMITNSIHNGVPLCDIFETSEVKIRSMMVFEVLLTLVACLISCLKPKELHKFSNILKVGWAALETSVFMSPKIIVSIESATLDNTESNES